MDFLETDFHKEKQPKRKVEIQNSKGLLVTIDLKSYPDLDSEVRKLLIGKIDKLIIKESKFLKRNHRNVDPDSILKILLEYQNESKINDQPISGFHINQTLGFLGRLKNYYFAEAKYNDIQALHFTDLQKALNDYLTENTDTNEETIDNVVNICHESLSSVFSKDIIEDLNILHTNKQILEKQDYYLYFHSIKYGNQRFPIFYIPVTLERVNEQGSRQYELALEDRVFINKKAIEFLIQELQEKSNLDKNGRISSIKERILYVEKWEEIIPNLNKIIRDIKDYFDFTHVDKDVMVSNVNVSFGMSQDLLLTVFDKADEALVNDYEEMLLLLEKEEDEISRQFVELIDGFIAKEPVSFDVEVNKDWSNLPIVEQLLSESPIPLNSEQRKILTALSKENCNYITIQGPPGTGKSHTISAIVFDYVLNNKSVLVLSDKTEALDVVEDKIHMTLKAARESSDFQNPILRLGKKQNSYSKIFSQQSIDSIKSYSEYYDKFSGDIEENYSRILNIAKSEISLEISSYSKISINQIFDLGEQESNLNDFFSNLESDAFKSNNDIASLERLISNFCELKKILESDLLFETLHDFEEIFDFSIDDLNNLTCLRQLSDKQRKIEKLIYPLIDEQKTKEVLSLYNGVSDEKCRDLKQLISKYEKEKSELLYFLRKGKVRDEFEFNLTGLFPDHIFGLIEEEIINLNRLINLNEALSVYQNELEFGQDLVRLSQFFVVEPKFRSLLTLISRISNHWLEVENNNRQIPIDLIEFNSRFLSSTYEKIDELLELGLNEYLEYLKLRLELIEKFAEVPNSKYLSYKKEIEKLNTKKMAHILDQHLLNFVYEKKNTAREIKDIIKKKSKFPKEKFFQLKEAFPCILASIRDYAEYIPLEPNMFDLVIIDEASQVSIAQVFPALIRAKKVLVLGDRQQFSNVKTNLARTDINTEYMNHIRNSFKKTNFGSKVSDVKIENFNIKNSILNFFEHVSNYDGMLKKHFRGYKELISYSNKYFYGNQLQVMKIRACSIDEAIVFESIKNTKVSKIRNTNINEIEFLIEKLSDHLDSRVKSSIGIITPHTNQQKLLIQTLSNHKDYDLFIKELRLKVMTFDTCQGEERDIIYYSMVADDKNDHLSGIFLKDFSAIEDDIEGKIKAQRLNVGFSRAKEKIVFVLSKPSHNFSGEIRNALLHYETALSKSRSEVSIEKVDKRSPMEQSVLNWYYQTNFYTLDNGIKELFPQFELGQYLRQLDKNYNHPNYRVDFLVRFIDNNQNKFNIIIEYDGFYEHFKQYTGINENNYIDFYNEADIERQKILESYGYHFIRLNKFNLTDNPIYELNRRLENVTRNIEINRELSFTDYSSKKVRKEISAVQCPKCKYIVSLSKFNKEKQLCIDCISIDSALSKVGVSKNKIHNSENNNNCPKCGSPMIRRTGRYGDFYGCSKFPKCYGSRSIKS